MGGCVRGEELAGKEGGETSNNKQITKGNHRKNKREVLDKQKLVFWEGM